MIANDFLANLIKSLQFFHDNVLEALMVLDNA
jgi:hypothetical protein